MYIKSKNVKLLKNFFPIPEMENWILNFGDHTSSQPHELKVCPSGETIQFTCLGRETGWKLWLIIIS